MQIEKLTLENTCLRSAFKVSTGVKPNSLPYGTFCKLTLLLPLGNIAGVHSPWAKNFALLAQVASVEQPIREAGPTDAEFMSSKFHQHVLYLEVCSTV